MNIESVNRLGENFLSFAWLMLWQSSLLIAVIFALDFVSARKIRPAVRHALWMIVLLKLLLPPTLALPTSAAWWLWPAKPALTPVFKNTTVTFDTTIPYAAPPTGPVVEPPARLYNSGWAMLASAAVSAGLLFWLTFHWLKVARKVRRAATPGDFDEALKEAKRLADLRRPIQLKLIDDEQSPAVYGLFRPVILLPRALAEKLLQQQVRAVLVHEAVHVRRGDVWVNCAQTLLQILYWWHPLLWFANARIRRLREEAVDDAVMTVLRDDADAYAPTLLEVARFAFRRPLASLGLVGILESRSALRQRIERLVDFRPPRTAGVTLLSLCGIFAFSAMALPMGQAPVSTADSLPANLPSSPTSAPPTRTAVLIEGRFFWMRSSDVKTLTAGLPSGSGQTGRAGNWTANAEKWDEINQRINSLNLKPSGTPRIQTISGNAASLYVGNQTHWFKWNCIPLAANGNIDLTFNTEVASVSTANETNRLELDGQTTVKNNGGLIICAQEPDDASSNLVLVIGVKTVEPAAAFDGATVARTDISKLLNRIQLPEVSYHDLTFSEVLRDLRSQSVKLDPKHKGLNFLYNPNEPGLTNNPAGGASEIHISLKLNNVSMAQVLDGICLVADRPIKFTVEDYGVVFSPMRPDSQQYEMRTFKVDTDLFSSRLKEYMSLSNSVGLMPSFNYSVREPIRDISFLAKEFFQSLGVNLDPPKTMFFNDRLGILFVYATPKDLDVIERALTTMNVGTANSQIHIKARFIDMPLTPDDVADLLPLRKSKDLGYGILTAPQMKALLHKLQSQNGVEELAEPEATTLGGRQIQMRATETQQVLTNYLLQPLPGPRHPTILPQISNVEFGPMFDVVPLVLADGYTISLKAIGSRTQFFGYADPKGLKGFTTNYDGGEIQLPVTLPAIQVSSASVQDALLFDDQTLVLLAKTEQLLYCSPDEKFRERVAGHIQQAEKKDGNKTLVVFVTMTLIDPVGNRLHSDDQMSFAQNTIPPQPQISDTVVP